MGDITEATSVFYTDVTFLQPPRLQSADIFELEDVCFFSPFHCVLDFSLMFHPLVSFCLSPQKHELLLRATVGCLSSLLGFLQRKSPATGTGQRDRCGMSERRLSVHGHT